MLASTSTDLLNVIFLLVDKTIVKLVSTTDLKSVTSCTCCNLTCVANLLFTKKLTFNFSPCTAYSVSVVASINKPAQSTINCCTSFIFCFTHLFSFCNPCKVLYKLTNAGILKLGCSKLYC